MAKKDKTIYDLKLHETLEIFVGMNAIKVHGGWIYQNLLKNYRGELLGTSSVFVPYEESK